MEASWPLSLVSILNLVAGVMTLGCRFRKNAFCIMADFKNLAGAVRLMRRSYETWAGEHGQSDALRGDVGE